MKREKKHNKEYFTAFQNRNPELFLTHPLYLNSICIPEAVLRTFHTSFLTTQ